MAQVSLQVRKVEEALPILGQSGLQRTHADMDIDTMRRLAAKYRAKAAYIADLALKQTTPEKAAVVATIAIRYAQTALNVEAFINA